MDNSRAPWLAGWHTAEYTTSTSTLGGGDNEENTFNRAGEEEEQEEEEEETINQRKRSVLWCTDAMCRHESQRPEPTSHTTTHSLDSQSSPFRSPILRETLAFQTFFHKSHV